MLQATGVNVVFRTGYWSHKSASALTNVSISLAADSALGVIGPSGAGKSTLSMVCAGLLRPNGGQVFHNGTAVHTKRGRINKLPHTVQMVFQNPFAALNPRRAIGEWLRSLLRRRSHNGQAHAHDPKDYLELVHLPQRILKALPCHLSGGECQRACIAGCLSAGACALILDEPLGMLDPITQDEIIELLLSLRKDQGLAYFVCTHDLSLIARLCDDLIVLAEGTMVESGPTGRVLEHPEHPLTRQLASACLWNKPMA